MPPKSKKKPMTSKFEFWNDLPVEMRMECIKRMDFKTRMRLRATSKQDKSLVESAPKYQFDSVKVELEFEYMPGVNCRKSGRSEVKIVHNRGRATPEFRQKAWNLVSQILKFSNAENLDFASDFKYDAARRSEFLANISNLAPFHFKNLTLTCGKFKMIDFFLKNCDSLHSLILIRCGNDLEEDKLLELMRLPKIVNVKRVQLANMRTADIPLKILEDWIFNKYNVNPEKTIEFRVIKKKLMGFLATFYKKRVVSKTAKTLRLRTNNPSNHALITTHLQGEIYYTFTLIPADSNDSELKNDDQWAKLLDESDLARYHNQFNLAAADLSIGPGFAQFPGFPSATALYGGYN